MDNYGFEVINFSLKPSRFWVTVAGINETPFTLKADKDDILAYFEDQNIDAIPHLKSLCQEQYVQEFVYPFTAYLLEGADEMKTKLLLCAKIFSIMTDLRPELEPRKDTFTLRHKDGQNLSGRRDDDGLYTNSLGDSYRVWIDGPGLKSIENYLGMYEAAIRAAMLKIVNN